jgi:hypothetical protein
VAAEELSGYGSRGKDGAVRGGREQPSWHADQGRRRRHRERRGSYSSQSLVRKVRDDGAGPACQSVREGGGGAGRLLTVYIRIKLHIDLQADKSPVIVKAPFFPRAVDPRYRIHGTMCNARIQSSKARKYIF